MMKAIQMVVVSSSSSLLSTTSFSSFNGISSIVSQNIHKWNIIKLKPNTINNNNNIIIVASSNYKTYSSYPCVSTITPSFYSKTNQFIESPVSRMSLSSSSLSPSLSAAPQPAGHVLKVKFCQFCGGQTKHEIPDGEEKIRAICILCGKIAYQNPKMVVGCLIEHEGKVLLCKRNIEPSYGLWTLPAGYMEIGESGAEGAIRETWEEARAEVELLSPFAQLDIPLIGQTYMIFLAKLKKPYFAPGPESLECQLFALGDIPFDSLAFSSIYVTLSLYKDDVKNGRLKFHYGTINKRPGSGPSDARAYTLDCHMES